MSLFLKLYVFVMQYKNVGIDEHGNRYFEQKNKTKNSLKKRYVLYKKKSDPTTIPVKWYQWLHRIGDENLASYTKKTTTPRKPNLTGTCNAHRANLDTYVKDKNYESWIP